MKKKSIFAKKIIMMVVAITMILSVARFDALAANNYTINGVTVSVNSFSSSPNECWVYANNLYNKIWGHRFTNQFNDSENCLRNLSDSEITLTPEHLEAYVSYAKPGAVLRICDIKYLHSNDGWGHSQIIVQIDDEGFTVLQGGLSRYPYKNERYYTWNEYCNAWDYAYIKYIKWPGAPEYEEYRQPAITTNPAITSDVTAYSSDEIVTLRRNEVEHTNFYKLTVYYEGEQILSANMPNDFYRLEDLEQGYYEAYLQVGNDTTEILTSTKHVFTVGHPVTFDLQGGVVDASETDLVRDKLVDIGGTYGTLPTPTKEGFVFVGWYTAPTAGTKITSDSIVSKTTLYAHWATEIPCEETHAWNTEYTIDVEPTFAQEGSKSIHCANCDLVQEGSVETLPTLEIAPLANPFVDNIKGAYFYQPVLWAYHNSITAGTSGTTFDPMDSCTRGQMVTFLHRVEGKPAPVVGNNPFADVDITQYYGTPVLWAVENEIAAGISATAFAPEDTVTRGQAITFLWRMAGRPEPTIITNPFADVAEDAFYYEAVLWAVENGITSGVSATSFAPENECTRGQVVTFLYRADQ